MFFDLIVKRSAADAENCGSQFFVSANVRERHADEFVFDAIEGGAYSKRTRSLASRFASQRCLTYSLGNELRHEIFSVNHQNGRLNDVLEFPNVARPGISP